MAVHLGKEIQECREHAAECARKAQRASSESARADFLRLERNWLQLARSYEFAQRLLLGDATAAASPRDAGASTPRSGLQ